MDQLITWIATILGIVVGTVLVGQRWRKDNVRRSVDESQATVPPHQTTQGVKSGQASQLAADLPQQKLEAAGSGQTSQATVNTAKLPVWYLEHATQCMEAAQQMTSGSDSTKVKLYQRQCKYLAEQLETAIKNSQEALDRSLSPEHKAECLDTLKLLYRLAKEVVSFIKDCCEDATWMQAALTPASVPLRVSSWGCRLKLCSKLLCNSNRLGAAWLTFTQLEGLGEAELLAVKEKGSYDEDTLMRLLGSLMSLSSQSKSNFLERHVELVTILLKRLKAIQAISTRASPLSSNLEAWKVEGAFLNQSFELVSMGSMAEVHEGVWFGAIEVALKTFVTDISDSGDAFEKEVAIVAGLSHPNIASFLGYGANKNDQFIVLELMDGDLRTLMEQRMQEDSNREGPFSIWVACDIMLQVAEAVLYMHQNGVVHRDLKSVNILVRSSKDGDAQRICAKVSNFGVAKRTKMSKTYSSQTRNVGTTRWMAPELIRMARDNEAEMSTGEGVLKYPFKWDSYGFGMLCYEILTGDVPFSRSSPGQVRRKVLQGDRPELPRQCPQSVKNLLELCWDPQPIARPTSTEICEELPYIRCSLLLGTSPCTA